MTAKSQMRKSARQSDQKKSYKSRSEEQQSTQSFDIFWKASLEDYVTALAWSPDGDILAAGSASGEVILRVKGQSVLLRSAAMEQTIDALNFSADGQYLAAAGQQGKVFVWDIGELGLAVKETLVRYEPALVLKNDHGWIDSLAWHPSEPYLAFGVGSRLKVWDILQESLVSDRNFTDSSVLDIAWHPDGKLIAASGHTGVKVWATGDWDAAPTLIEVPGASLSVAWSADGRYLASGNLDRTLTVVDWGHPPPWLMQGFPGKVRQVAWATSLTGDLPVVAAACVEGITVWRQQGKRWQSKVLTKHEETVEAIAFHPKVPLLASAAKDGRLCLWRKAASLQQTLRGVAVGFSAIAWHPQGHYLAAGGTRGELMMWAPSNRGKGFQSL